MGASDTLAARDRFGLGWRPELAAGLLAHLDRLDLVEVIADDWLGVPPARARALRTLAAQVPVSLHGVGLGAASAAPVDRRRVDALARLVNLVEPVSWSEHLAFVRGGGHEIGHLAAPPRSDAVLAGTAANVAAVARAVGTRPLLENVATLIDPPGSTMDEPEWLGGALAATGCDLLLDLHNLYANAVNFGSDPRTLLSRLPLDRVASVHIAGGRWIGPPGDAPGPQRLLDDHLHDVPDPVFDLLACLGAWSGRALTVVLEQDGRYPPVAMLMAQLDRARAALARGRALREAGVRHIAAPHCAPRLTDTNDTSPAFEACLARLYVDDTLRARFLGDLANGATGATEFPAAAGLTERERQALRDLDAIGLAMAGESFRRKRARQGSVTPRRGLWGRVLEALAQHTH
jgi:uncharacterized protein (UPF0276 family)